MSNEPAITIASIVALVGAVMTLLVVFGVEITDAQQKAVIAVVTVAGPIVAGLLIRRKVTPAP